MSIFREGKKKKHITIEPPPAISWQKKKDLADKEEVVLEKEMKILENGYDYYYYYLKMDCFHPF